VVACGKRYSKVKYVMQQYQQHIQMTDMGLFSSGTAELQSSSL